MILKGQARRFATGAEVDTKANEVDVSYARETELTPARDRGRQGGRSVHLCTHQRSVPLALFVRGRRWQADTSVGEETYAGERITNEPTWIGACVHGRADASRVCSRRGGRADGSPIDGTTNFVRRGQGSADTDPRVSPRRDEHRAGGERRPSPRCDLQPVPRPTGTLHTGQADDSTPPPRAAGHG